MIDLKKELVEALADPSTKELLREVVRDAVREELDATNDQELLDIKAAAKVVSLSPGALRKRVERGEIKCRRIGRSVRFARGDLKKLGR